MDVSEASAAVAIIVSVLTATVTIYRGWKRRVEDGARRPFVAGQVAIEEAQAALAMKDRRLGELEASEARSRADLITAKATIEGQQKQITSLQAQVYQVTARNTELEATAAATQSELRSARERISSLEESLEMIKRKMSLGEGY